MYPAGLIAFGIGYLGLALAVARGRGPVAAIGVMIGVYGLYTLIYSGPSVVSRSLLNLLEWSNLSVFVYIFLSLMIAGLLRELGYLDQMVAGASSIGCRFSYAAVPAIIGLLPMPGGAIVSAIAMKKRYLEESGMSAEWASYLNYWFRHIWIPSWPLFQSVVITAAVFSVTPIEIVSVTWPATIVTVFAGIAVGYTAFYKYTCTSDGRILYLLRSLWPFLLLAALVVSGSLTLLNALIVTLLAVIVILRPDSRQLLGALKLALKPRIHAILFEALLLKEMLLNTDAPYELYNTAELLGLPTLSIVFLVPFILGLAAGGENFFAATAMPLLKAYIVMGGSINNAMLLAAYTGGFMGVMASPVHLCYALTVDYYKARAGRVLLFSLASVMLVSGIILMYIHAIMM
ncbi:MAG: DUF401 family protein [Desulfurococcales archaeon]|nr:DUF401 family protein [Desulfurococcales archaeon]